MASLGGTETLRYTKLHWGGVLRARMGSPFPEQASHTMSMLVRSFLDESDLMLGRKRAVNAHMVHIMPTCRLYWTHWRGHWVCPCGGKWGLCMLVVHPSEEGVCSSTECLGFKGYLGFTGHLSSALLPLCSWACVTLWLGCVCMCFIWFSRCDLHMLGVYESFSRFPAAAQLLQLT